MPTKTDKTTVRLLYIITKLNEGERLSIKELAERFDVTERSIQKDLNERLNQFLPIEKEDGHYYLESYLTGRLEYEDIKNFAILSGIQKLYPSLEDTFLADVLNSKINDSCLIRGGNYEDITARKNEFDTIRLAITLKHTLHFTYNNKERILNPYKLVNHDDIWYLVADEAGTLKTYSFIKISKLSKTEECYTPKQEYIDIINKNQANWFSQKSIKVILDIDRSVAEYFTRRKLLPNQTILKNTATAFILQTEVSYDEEILKVVRYWIPHIKIIEPEYLQDKLQNELTLYLNS